MRWLLYLFGSGQALFLGASLILAAVAWLHRTSGWRAATLAILARLGMFVAVISAVPLSYWLYGLALGTTAVWLWHARRPAKTTHPLVLRRATAIVWLGIILLELPHQWTPRLPPQGNPPLYILGDSVTAGLGGGEEHTWPDLLPASVEVHNLARPGATTATVLKNQCDQLPAAGGLLLIEIGGNDLLGETSSVEFERDLDALLNRVATPGRTVLMFELPLPPLCNEYGRIQRRLSARHGARLIPKRVFMGVLAGRETTLDSLHLSEAGHRRMAEATWSIVGSAYRQPD